MAAGRKKLFMFSVTTELYQPHSECVLPAVQPQRRQVKACNTYF